MRFRSLIPDFQLANPLYVGATVTFYLADETGRSTGALATLYSQPVGTVTTNNPQVLDGDGKFTRPVYIDASVIGEVTSQNVASHDTGVIYPRGNYRGAWTKGLTFYSGDIITNAAGDNLYAVASDFIGGQSFGDDLSAGKFIFILGMAIANAARAEAVAAAASAALSRDAAAASAQTAANAAGSVDAEAINNRFIAAEGRLTTIESDDYLDERIALGIAYQGAN